MIAASGTQNHIHLLANAPMNISISELLNQIKVHSSKWYAKRDSEFLLFNWEEGYAAFTVSFESIDRVKHYFNDETNRHSKRSYEDELAIFLQIHGIEFKSKFISKTTYSQLIYHLVWTVKNREALLGDSIKKNLHEKIHDEIKKSSVKLHAIGNVNDHIHLLLECPTKVSTSDLVHKIKISSSMLINKIQNSRMGKFSWQEGFGSFSVGKPALSIAKNYVLNQEEHHKYRSFDDEWKKILEGNSLVDYGSN